MSVLYTVKGFKITLLHVIAVISIISIGGAAALLNHPVATQPTNVNPLIAAASSVQDTPFRDQRLTEAQGVDNIVNNVLSGEVKPGDGHAKLLEIELYAKGDINMSPEDMKTNDRYVNYVMSAEDVVDSYMYKTGNVDEMLKIMKDKKSNI
jgi:hypothetical protein